MPNLMNAIYLLDVVMFLAVAYIQTLRTPPPENVRAGWPLRWFWVSHHVRHLGLVFSGLAIVGFLVVVLGNVILGDEMPYRAALMAGGLGLGLLAGLALIYSVALYWQESPPEPDGF